MKKKIEVIDFLKGYSILGIVLFHFFQGISIPPLLAKLINFGGTGIHAFLFASGFGLYLSFLKKPLTYPEFLRKRFTKIYIPYMIVVTASALIALAIPIYENSWNNYLSHLFLYKMFDDHLIGTYGYQFWFVSTIIQLYLVFPLLVWLKEKIPGPTFVLTGLAISVAWAFFVLSIHKADQRNWGGFFLTLVWEFMLGMYLAEAYLKKGFQFWALEKWQLVLAAVLGIGLYAIMALKGGDFGKMLNDIPALFGYCALAMFIYSLGIGPLNRFVLFTSNISFSIFLLHFLVFNLLHSLVNALHLPWNALMLVPGLICCYLLAVPMERFLNRLIDRLLNERKPASAIILKNHSH